MNGSGMKIRKIQYALLSSFLLGCMLLSLDSVSQKIDCSLRNRLHCYGFLTGALNYECFFDDLEPDKTTPLIYQYKRSEKFLKDTLAVAQNFVSNVQVMSSVVLKDSSICFDTLQYKLLDLDSNLHFTFNVLLSNLVLDSTNYEQRLNILGDIPYYKCVHFYNETEGIEIYKFYFETSFIKKQKIAKEYVNVFSFFYTCYAYPIRNRLVNKLYIFWNDENNVNHGLSVFDPQEIQQRMSYK